jgi:hypothetical protein
MGFNLNLIITQYYDDLTTEYAIAHFDSLDTFSLVTRHLYLYLQSANDFPGQDPGVVQRHTKVQLTKHATEGD